MCTLMLPIRSTAGRTVAAYHHHLLKRCHHEVRVRFAPSPTGYLHLGGLRTALYNFLYARSKGGKFLLRIEDTDQTRLVADATQRLIDDLLWAGIEIDEGPSFGGQHGPYVQSERNAIYLDAVQVLLNSGSAYRCFCTERRLELLRKDALRTRQIPRYDNKCRHITPEQTAELVDKKTPHCIRFKLTEHTEPLADLIYGAVQHDVSATEGDPVIIKSDLFPTYHFANVVDDHFMGITHVFRGVEWQISTTKHLLLYKAFGWSAPQYGHLPLLVNADGTKLSKRQGDIGIAHFREKGYFPIALLNYVVSAGGGFERAQGTRAQIYSIEELAQQFNIAKVNSHPSRLNPDLLDDFNRLEIIKLVEDKTKITQLIEHVQNLVYNAYPKEQNLDLDAKHVENVLRWCAQRLTLLHDLITPKLSFLWVKPKDFIIKDITEDKLCKLLPVLEIGSYQKDDLNSSLKSFAEQEKIKFPLLMKTLRSALSGLKEGPGVAEMMEILGKEAVKQRINDAIQNKHLLKAQNKS